MTSLTKSTNPVLRGEGPKPLSVQHAPPCAVLDAYTEDSFGGADPELVDAAKDSCRCPTCTGSTSSAIPETNAPAPRSS